MCASREQGAQTYSVQTTRWNSGSIVGDRQMGGYEMGGQSMCPMHLWGSGGGTAVERMWERRFL